MDYNLLTGGVTIMGPFMIFLTICVSLSCDMVINDSAITGEYYQTQQECQAALPEVLRDYNEGNFNPKLHYYAECSDKVIGLGKAGWEV